MIQRIQTIFWLLSIVLVIVFIMMFKVSSESGLYTFSLAGFVGLFNLFAILSFKNRRKQLVLSYVAMIGMLGLLAYITVQNQSAPGAAIILPICLLATGIILNLIANYFTRKDIKLVEESSRLR
jgi:hypothetical protein